jgi:hypothetical protein
MMKAAIFNLGSRGQNAIYGIFWHQPKSKDEDLLKRGTHYVSQAVKGFVAPGYRYQRFGVDDFISKSVSSKEHLVNSKKKIKPA